MRLLFILTFCLLLSYRSLGQSAELDSMKQLLPRQTGVEKLNTLLALAYQDFEFNSEASHQYALQALAEARAIHHKPGEKHALTLIGEYYYNVSDYPKAKDFYDQSARISVKEGGNLYTGYNQLMRANLFLEEPDYDSAQVYFQYAFNLIEQENHYKIKYYAYLSYSTFLCEKNQLDAAKKILESLYVEAEKNNAAANQAEILIELGCIEENKDEYRNAREYLMRAKSFLPQNEYSYVKFIYLYQLAHLEYYMGNNFAAIMHLKEVLSVKEIEQYDEIKADMMALAGNIYVERGELGLAMKSYLEAVKICEQVGIKQQLGQVYSDIAWLYFKQFNDSETARFANMALGIATEIRDESGIARAHSILGSLYAAQKRYTEALREHEIALEIRKKLNYRARIADSYYNLSSTYEKMGQLDKAIYYANQSMEIDEILGDMLNRGLSYKKNASLYILQNHYGKAKELLTKAVTIAKISSSPELRRDVELLFTELYEKTGDFKSANEHLHQAIEANDSLYNIAGLQKIAEIRGLFDLENIELKSKQQEQALELQSIALDRQRDYNIMVVIILILVSVFLFIGAFLYNSSRKNNIKLRVEIAERNKVESQLLQSQLMFEEAQTIAQVGSWEFNLLNSDLHWSKETYRIFELNNHSEQGLYEAYRKKCHPEDIPKLDSAIENTLHTGSPFHVEHRVVLKGGVIKYIACIGEAVKDSSGNIIGLKGTDQDITLQKQAEIAKSEFLSSMSHEIRTPINGVIGIANLLGEEPLSPVQREYVSTLKFSAEHLSSVVSDILDFSKIESGQLSFESLPFNLDHIASNVLKLFENDAKGKQVQLTFCPDPHLNYLLSGDYVRLSQVLSNLLSNALKFTEEGAVELAYSIQAETENKVTIHFTIKDTGIGIEAHQLERIFDNFAQADVSTTRKYGGTGLGLTISKKLVELQGGTISVKSNPGEGSVFSVEMTYEKLAQIPPGAEANIPAQAMDLRGMKLLIAEDNKVNVLVLSGVLKKWGAIFFVAKEGQEAIEWVQKEDFDAIIMDIQMPNLDGREATHFIRQMAEDRKRRIPIIAFTAEASIESQQGFLTSGFNDCITKPFQPEELYRILKKYQRPVEIRIPHTPSQKTPTFSQ